MKAQTHSRHEGANKAVSGSSSCHHVIPRGIAFISSIIEAIAVIVRHYRSRVLQQTVVHGHGRSTRRLTERPPPSGQKSRIQTRKGGAIIISMGETSIMEPKIGIKTRYRNIWNSSLTYAYYGKPTDLKI